MSVCAIFLSVVGAAGSSAAWPFPCAGRTWERSVRWRLPAGNRARALGGRWSSAAEDGKSLGLDRLFALSCEPAFFHKLGFRTVDKAALPTKVWRDCIHCPRADHCDEVATVLDLEP